MKDYVDVYGSLDEQMNIIKAYAYTLMDHRKTDILRLEFATFEGCSKNDQSVRELLVSRSYVEC